MYKPYSQKRYDAAVAAFNALPDIDQSLFALQLVDGGFELSDDMVDALDGSGDIADRLIAILDGDDATDDGYAEQVAGDYRVAQAGCLA